MHECVFTLIEDDGDEGMMTLLNSCLMCLRAWPNSLNLILEIFSPTGLSGEPGYVGMWVRSKVVKLC